MQFNDALQRLSQLRARLDDLRTKSQLDPACLSENLLDASFELQALEKLLEEKLGFAFNGCNYLGYTLVGVAGFCDVASDDDVGTCRYCD